MKFVGHSGIQWKGFDKIGRKGEREKKQETQRIVCRLFRPHTLSTTSISMWETPESPSCIIGVGEALYLFWVISHLGLYTKKDNKQGLVFCIYHMDLCDLLNALNVLTRHKESTQEGMTGLGDERKEPGHLMWLFEQIFFFQANHFLMALS